MVPARPYVGCVFVWENVRRGGVFAFTPRAANCLLPATSHHLEPTNTTPTAPHSPRTRTGTKTGALISPHCPLPAPWLRLSPSGAPFPRLTELPPAGRAPRRFLAFASPAPLPISPPNTRNLSILLALAGQVQMDLDPRPEQVHPGQTMNSMAVSACVLAGPSGRAPSRPYRVSAAHLFSGRGCQKPNVAAYLDVWSCNLATSFAYSVDALPV